jgi:hypothetical protein
MLSLLQLLRMIVPDLWVVYVMGMVGGGLFFIAVDSLTDWATYRWNRSPPSHDAATREQRREQLASFQRKFVVNGRRILIAIEATVIVMAILGLTFTGTWSVDHATAALVIIVISPVFLIGPPLLFAYMYYGWKVRKTGRSI